MEAFSSFIEFYFGKLFVIFYLLLNGDTVLGMRRNKNPFWKLQ